MRHVFRFEQRVYLQQPGGWAFRPMGGTYGTCQWGLQGDLRRMSSLSREVCKKMAWTPHG